MDGISYKKWMERAAGLFLSALIAVLLTMLFLAVFAFAMLKGNLSASGQFFRFLHILCQSLIDQAAHNSAFHRTAHVLPLHWRARLKDRRLFFGVIRVGMGQAFVTDTTAFFTMMLYCAAGGMLGGMLS